VRVLINRFVTLGRKTGIGHYTAQLLRCLHEQALPGEISDFPAGLAWNVGQACAGLRPFLTRGEKANQPRTGVPEQGTVSRPGVRQKTLDWLWHLSQAWLARRLRQTLAGGCDLYHEPNLIPLPCDHPTVTTLHDLSALLHPEWHPARRARFFEKHFVPSLQRSVHFFAISEFSRREAITTLHLPPERVTRVYMGIRPDLKPWPEETVAAGLRRRGWPPRYLLHVGTIEPRKNLLMLLRAYCGLPDVLRQRWPLLLVGGWGWHSHEVSAFLDRQGRQRGVIHIGYARDEDLALLYNGARALVFPSHYEGFGLPPVEMMACGGAVLASTAGAVVETVGSRACLLDPGDVDGWREAMARVLQDEDWWRSLRTDVLGLARKYTWDQCAADTLRVYRSLCEDAGSHTRQAHAA
jgi:alpha-1,3-rhamnosyl/mannosyltransferase